MASPLSFFFLSLALLCCFSYADLINDVCSKTINPSLCSKSLRSDPRSRGAGLKLLGQISIDLATARAKSGATLVTRLKNGERNPKLKGIYHSCLENYEDGVDNLVESSLDLKNGDYGGVNIKASAAETDIDTCDENFQGRGAPAEPRQLVAANQKAQSLCSAILVISNRLLG